MLFNTVYPTSYYAWQHDANEFMRLDATGQLGVGITPAYKLDIAGSTRLNSTTAQQTVISGTIFAQNINCTQIQGLRKPNIALVSGTVYYTTTTDEILSVSGTLFNTTTVKLRTSQLAEGRIFVVKDSGGNATVNNVTITPEGTEKIDGASTFVINDNYGAANIYSDGKNWYVY